MVCKLRVLYVGSEIKSYALFGVDQVISAGGAAPTELSDAALRAADLLIQKSAHAKSVAVAYVLFPAKAFKPLFIRGC